MILYKKGEFQLGQRFKNHEFFNLIFIGILRIDDVPQENVLRQVLAEIEGMSDFQSNVAENGLLLQCFPIISPGIFLIILGMFAVYSACKRE